MSPAQIIATVRACALLLCVAVVFGIGYRLGSASGRAAVAECKAKAEKTVAQMAKAESELQAKYRKAEQAKAQALADVAEQYEQDKTNAKTAHDRLVADLRAGHERLHQRWRASEATARLSGAVASAAELDAAERDRQESAARAIAAADQCDAQVKGLQDVVRADRK